MGPVQGRKTKGIDAGTEAGEDFGEMGVGITEGRFYIIMGVGWREGKVGNSRTKGGIGVYMNLGWGGDREISKIREGFGIGKA